MKSRRALVVFTALWSINKNFMVSAGSVNGLGPRLLALSDRYGQSPCILEEQACPPSQSNSSSTFLDQDVGECTCNVVFFNLWSACLVSNGNSVLPTFDQWNQSCSNNSLDVSNTPPAINIVRLPAWANMPPPNPTNTTFDVGAAIMIALASTGRPWTTVQIITPILSVVATLAILGCWYLYQCSTQRNDDPWFKGRKPALFRRVHKVKETRRGEAWTIDLAENLGYGYDGRQGMKSSQLYDPPRPAPAGPGHRQSPSLWKNELPQILSFGKPAVVRNVAPGRGWRISSLDDATGSPNFLSLSPQAVAEATNHHPIPEGEDEDVQLNDPRAEAEGDDDQETDHLISPSERSENTVFLISRRPGENFTIESSPAGSRIPCSPDQMSPPIVQRDASGFSEAVRPSQGLASITPSHPIQPPSRSIKESPKGSSIPKSFLFFPKLKISKAGKVSRDQPNEPNLPPSRMIAEGASLPSSPPFQIPELLPLAPTPPHINNRFPGLGRIEASPYSSFHQSSSSQSFPEDAVSRNGRPSLSRASLHHRAASHDVRGVDSSVLHPGRVLGAVYSTSHLPRRPST